MCRSGLHVKFCTCSADELLDYPKWELWRPNTEPALETWNLRAVGSFMEPALEHELLVDRVLQDLNRSNAFDADIDFRSEDNLIMHWNEDDALIFRYDGRKWSSSSAIEEPDTGLLLKTGSIEARAL